MRSSRPRTGQGRFVFGVVCAVALWCAGCGRVASVALLTADPCEVLSEEQEAELLLLVLSGDYPAVEEIVSAYEYHCCIDDAMAGRDEAVEACLGVGG